jgi:hypothetical protein
MYENRTPVGGGVELSEQVIQIILKKLDSIEDEQRRSRAAQESLKDSFNEHLQEYARQKAVLQEKDKQFINLQCEHEVHKTNSSKVEGATMLVRGMWAVFGGAITVFVMKIAGLALR